MVLILNFITCGLYGIYWNMKVMEVLNAASGREVFSPVVAAAGPCCFPLNIYFYHTVGVSLVEQGTLRNNPALGADKTLILILGIIFPVAAPMIVQKHINALYGA